MQHGYVRGALGHLRHQCDRCGAAADHDHALAAVVERFIPELWMQDAAAEAVLAGKRRAVALGIAVVAGADIEQAGAQAQTAVIRRALGLDRPAGRGAVPCGADDLVAEADMLGDAGFLGGLADIGADRRPVGDGLGAAPGLEAVAQRVHVRVRADAGVAEQVPGAADGIAGFQDGVALAGAAHLQVARGANAGQAGAYDQDIQDGIIGAGCGHVRHPGRVALLTT
ncbi:hypothetical protein D9M70_433730 [compost metagenome]